ncbi:EamA family transporter [Oceanobacillus piezotolerans]|uniref:EamA family transporter n=1 Tax=Oceanobacillus piezotolerans TaxID=2448030 RepID=A0A498D9M4_9BACI|nr:EamA family transporter [Oceanobacillus piezotolerans]RLL45517.1 EamA family transporter [Oceanobacillus piezotolerans]
MKKAAVFIIIGAALWGTIGWYVKHLYGFGFTPMEVVTLRVFISAILLSLYVLITSPKKFTLHRYSDLKYFIGTGIFSITFFNYCLFKTMEISTIPVATALLYTAPAMVTIISYFVFKEAITKMKLIALTLTLTGTCFVVGLIPLNMTSIQMSSILIGLGSGLGYAFYSIFSKFALQKYDSLTITSYTFIVAAIALVPFFPFQEKFYLLLQPSVLFYAFGLGLLPTAFAYIIYTYGLNRTEASRASILSTVEPVIATLIGIFIFQESITSMQMIGMICIIGGVLFIQGNKDSGMSVTD